jgi:hypothetical protein
MLYEQNSEVMRALLKATKAGKVQWKEDPNDRDVFLCCYGENYTGYIEFLYVEAVSRAGADKHIVHVSIRGFNCFFACGTEGFMLAIEVLAAADSSWKEHLDGSLDGNESAMRDLQ